VEILGGVQLTLPVDGFRLAYERVGRGPAVVLLHGWPGDRTDYTEVVPLVSATADVVVPDLRGFGESDKHPVDPGRQYSADAQARSVIGLIEELRLDRPVVAGYDVGSRIAQTVARSRPELVRSLVVSPPLPGIGQRILTARAQQEFWYQPFHQLLLADLLVDGRPADSSPLTSRHQDRAMDAAVYIVTIEVETTAFRAHLDAIEAARLVRELSPGRVVVALRSRADRSRLAALPGVTAVVPDRLEHPDRPA